MSDELTDQETVELLRLLARYCNAYPTVDIDVSELRIKELAGDLYDSLPSLEQHQAAADAAACKADSLRSPLRWPGRITLVPTGDGGGRGPNPDAPPSTLSKPEGKPSAPSEEPKEV